MRALGLMVALLTATGAAAQVPYPYPPDPLGRSAPALEPAPDPQAWWTAPETRNELLDPLGGRKAGKGAAAIAAPVDASVYRLWGLTPLQTQVLRRDETVYEVWVRPVDASRQMVVRIVLRTDGRAFLQARAGRGCCAPGISRRVDIERELDAATEARVRALKTDPAWAQPQHVLVQEEGAVSAVCVDGTAYDLMRVEARRSVHLRRSCDPAEVGSAANALRVLLGAAQGLDPRFDAAFKGGVGFEKEAAEYAALQARGGRLRARLANTASAREAEPPPAPLGEADEGLAEDDPRAQVLAADRAFAARAGQVGTAQAFREFMDEDEGKVFPTGADPAVGDDAIFALMGGTEPPAGRLLWEPAEAYAAESGEVAMTWGRSRFVPNDPDQPEREGRYITVWRKDEDGRWKGLWDLGNMRQVEGSSARAAAQP
jgi:ketosteroid isomerase-like protein